MKKHKTLSFITRGRYKVFHLSAKVELDLDFDMDHFLRVDLYQMEKKCELYIFVKY